MTPKERVITALDHKNPDRCPCDYLGTPEIDEKLKNFFKTDDMNVILEKLGVDLRVVDAPYIGPALRTWDDGRFENYWGSIRKMIKNEMGVYNEAVEFPYAAFKTIEDVENFRWPQPQWFDYDNMVAECGKYSNYAVVFGAPANMDLINGTSYGRGVEQLIYDIALEDPIGLACMSKRFECCYAISENALRAANGKIDILWIGDDYGTQNGLLISPQAWKKLFFPPLKQMCELGHKYGAKVMLHSCGSTQSIWPELIKAGVDIYQTVQPEAFNMNPADLKKDFGDDICFHGTISIQKTLPFGTPEDVARQVRRRIDTVGVNGGLILAPAHNIQPDTPTENILALYEEVAKV